MPYRQNRSEMPAPDIKEALRNWQDAQKYFDSVSSDPDLVDVAIYDLEAARRRYSYMLKRIRQGR
jgi:hypothetical protein